MKDVLIYTDRTDLEHKLRGEVPVGHECYWTVNGTPQRTERGQSVLFTDGDRVIARGEITRVEEGRIWFEPLRETDEDLPAPPTTRGFKYVEQTDD